jgi:hypothetical protein
MRYHSFSFAIKVDGEIKQKEEISEMLFGELSALTTAVTVTVSPERQRPEL